MMLVRLLGELDRRYFESHVISLLPPGPLGDTLASMRIPVTSLGMRPGLPSPAALLRLARRFRALRPAVIQTWLYHADVMGLIAARLAGIDPVVWNLRASVVDLRSYGVVSNWTRRLGAMLSPRPAAVVVNSEAGLREHERLGYRPRRWVQIPNGIDTRAFAPDPAARTAWRTSLRIADGRFLIGMVARFDHLKGHDVFLDACGRLAQQRDDVEFVLAGRGVTAANPQLTDWIAAAKLAGRVHLLGERPDIPAVLAALDLYVMASRTEGFPTAVLEAMACAVPCVVTDVGDARQIAGDAAWVVPPERPEALSSAMAAAVAGGPSGLSVRGAAARQRIADGFTLAAVAARYAELYRSLAGATSG